MSCLKYSVWKHFQTKKNCRNILDEKLIVLITNILELISREKVDRLLYDCIRQRIFRGILRCKICAAEIGYRSVKTIERSSFGESNKSIPLTPADHHVNARRVILTGGSVVYQSELLFSREFWLRKYRNSKRYLSLDSIIEIAYS